MKTQEAAERSSAKQQSVVVQNFRATIHRTGKKLYKQLQNVGESPHRRVSDYPPWQEDETSYRDKVIEEQKSEYGNQEVGAPVYDNRELNEFRLVGAPACVSHKEL